MKSTADLIVHSALHHLAQCREHHLQRSFRSRSRVIAKEKIVDAGTRELGRSSESAELRIEHAPKGLECAIQHLASGRCLGGCETGIFAKLLDPLVAGFFHSCTVLPPCFGQPLQNGAESGTAVTVVGWEICAPEEGLPFRREPDRHGPASAPGGGLHEQHVHAIHVRALFAIYFYR